MGRSKMIIHAKDLTSMIHCPAKAWNEFYFPYPKIEYAREIVSFSTLWETYLNVPEGCEGLVWESNEKSKEILEKNGVGVHLHFEWNNLHIEVPYLKRVEGGYVAIYPACNISCKEKEKTLMAIHALVLKELGIDVIDFKMCYLNQKYEREKDLDLQQLFLISNHFSNKNHGFRAQTIREAVQKEMDALNLSVLIQSAKNILSTKKPISEKVKYCTSPKKCYWYDQCFQDQELENNDAQLLVLSSMKSQMRSRGIRRLKDIPSDLLEGFELQYAQVQADRNGGEYIDRSALKSWFSTLKYPYCYLDFEWDTFAFPPYEGMKPYDVLCFEYSLHIQHKDKKIEHKSFFGNQDCRIQFIEHLLNDLPDQGSIIVFNMEGAEKLRILQLAKQFPQYEKPLIEIAHRMVDLALLFNKGVYYHLYQRGKYSLKSLLPIFHPEKGYQDLEISDGMEVVEAYRKLETADSVEQERIIKAIDRYCSMDTLSEMIIVDQLKKKVGKD